MDEAGTIQVLHTLGMKVRQDLQDLYPRTYYRGRQHNLFELPEGGFRFFDEDFTGACGVSTYMLLLLARRHNITLEWVGHAHHFWCELDGTVIDPTYSQFDEDKQVWVGFPTQDHLPPCGQKWSRAGQCYVKGIFRGDKAKILAKRFPTVQNPFSKYHAPVLQKWMNSLR